MPLTPTIAGPSQERLTDMMARLLGDLALEALASDDVTELYLNPGEPFLRLDTVAGGRIAAPIPFSAARAEQFLNCAATLFGIHLSSASPQLHAQLPEVPFAGARLQGLLPPLVSLAAFNIRKHAPVIPLERYVQDGVMTGAQYEALVGLVLERKNIVVAGGTRSGKTTLANALLQEIAYQFPSDRLVILEDTAELRPSGKDTLAMRVPQGATLADLVRWTLRTAPDRIVVGEVRGEEALHLLDAWSTGHPGGVATVHAGDVPGALDRLDRLAQRAGIPPQRELVAAAVDAVVLIAGVGPARRIRAITRVCGLDHAGYYALDPLA